jgi:hypothetical protein
MTFLTLFVTLCLGIPLGLCAWHFIWMLQEQIRIQSAVDAAALAVVDDLNRITVNDENFGFVALTNMPPIGKATLSESGVPSPVIGYNTLVGTVRLDNLIADEVNDETFTALARSDADKLATVVKELNSALAISIDSTSTRQNPKDWNGLPVDAHRDALNCIASNMHIEAESIEPSKLIITLGSMRKATGTGVNIPTPAKLAQIPGNYAGQKFYSPFVDYPVAHKHFMFASCGISSTLCPVSEFRNATAQQVASIARLDLSITVREPDVIASVISKLGINPVATFFVSSCAKPGFVSDLAPPGVLTVQFANGQVGGLGRLRDVLIGAQLKSTPADTYTAQSGNYPDDASSQLVRNMENQETGLYSASGALSAAIFDWLRNQHCRPGILTVNELLDYRFKDQQQRLCTIFEIGSKGELVAHGCQKSPFSANTVAENQVLSQCNSATGFPCIMIIRNEVYRLGTKGGGKEAGQPLLADPINWCELPSYGGSPEEALKLRKGAKALNLSVRGSQSNRCQDSGAVSPEGVEFVDSKFKKLTLQPAPTYYSGGLCADILIGVTGQ